MWTILWPGSYKKSPVWIGLVGVELRHASWVPELPWSGGDFILGFFLGVLSQCKIKEDLECSPLDRLVSI